MNTDCAFYIGTTHNICQDYALAGNNSIVVSDGCSGSPSSDIGSRVLSITAMNKMAELDGLQNFDEKECILLARPAIKILNMPNECLDATLLAAVSYGDSVQAMCCGDGVIAIKTRDKDMIIINRVYENNYPYYINYLYDQTGRFKNWEQNHCEEKIYASNINKDGEVVRFEKELKYNSRINSIDGGDIGVFRQIDLNHRIMIEITDKKDIEYIAIMSDGVHSFYETIMTDTSRCNKSLNYIDVVKELLSFKNFNTSFVQRRINKFRKNCAKKNWGNADDVSLAVIYTGK